VADLHRATSRAAAKLHSIEEMWAHFHSMAHEQQVVQTRAIGPSDQGRSGGVITMVHEFARSFMLPDPDALQVTCYAV
jgi:hypothetical protein